MDTIGFAVENKCTNLQKILETASRCFTVISSHILTKPQIPHINSMITHFKQILSLANGDLRSHAEVNVGVVTGNNRFFLLSMDEARHHHVENWIYPLVSRSHQLKGAVLGEPEWQSLREKPHKTGLFCIPEEVNGDSDAAVRDYIRYEFHE